MLYHENNFFNVSIFNLINSVGSELLKIDTENLIRTLILINFRPRKCLNYVSSFEKFLHKISF